MSNIAVYAGPTEDPGNYIGFIQRLDLGFGAFDTGKVLLGVFADEDDAADAILFDCLGVRSRSNGGDDVTPEVHICVHCRRDPPDGNERPSAYNDEWLHPHCVEAFIRARMAEEGLLGDAPTAEPPPEPDRAQIETLVSTLFKHATAGTYVSLRAFFEDRADLPPFKIASIELSGDFAHLIDHAYRVAELAAHALEKVVFCPPIATFVNNKHAREQDLAEGLVLSTECDKAAPAARAKLEALLGSATVVVASGGESVDATTGEVEPKLHIHHRLKVPTRSKDEHRMLKEARRLAAMLVGADKTNVPVVHPIRWPGSLHRKKEPKLCHIVACNPDAEIDLVPALERLREAVEAEGSSAGAKSNGRIGPVAAAFAHLKPAGPVGRIEGPQRPSDLRAPCIEAVIGALAIIPNDELEWDEWNRVGMAAWGATEGSDEGGEAFAAWSAKSKKNDPATTDARWEHYQTSPPDRIGYGTLVYLARKVQLDWEPPLHLALQQEGPSWNPAELKVSFSNIPHRQWVYGTYLIRGEVTIVASPGGVGKTALVTGMAIEISTGIELLEERIWGTDLKVLSFNGEDGTVEMNRRMWAFSRAHTQQTGGQAPDRLYVLGIDDVRVQRLSFLRTDERSASHLSASGFKVLESALDAIRPDVLILDPLVAFCAGGNMNDNSVMALVMRELKRLAVEYNCAILVVHHTKKGGERGDQEAVSGAAAIVNLGRRALMPVPMTKEEATALGVLPSERFRYFKLVDAKTNFTPRSADSPWYALHSIELPNAEPPIYPTGDNVQAIVRATLPLPKTADEAANDQKIQKAILDLAARGKLIDGECYPYSPSVSGAKNMRALLDDALTVVAHAAAPRHWRPDDLRAVVQRTIDKMKGDGWLFEKNIKTGRFHGSAALHVDWGKTPWANPASPVCDGAATDAAEEDPTGGDEVDELDHELAELLGQTPGKK